MKQFPFQRDQRLLTPSEYKSVFDHVDVRVSHSGFLLLAHITEPTLRGRLGLVVSKKNVKKAVERNRFKRLVRDTFRINQSNLFGLDIVVLARSRVLEMSNPELIQALHKSWIKLKKRSMADNSVKKASNL